MIAIIEACLLFLAVDLVTMVSTIRRTVLPSGCRRRAMTKAEEGRIDPGLLQSMAGIEAQLVALGFSTPCRVIAVETPIVSSFESLAEHDGNLVTVLATRSARGTSEVGIHYMGGLGDGRRVVTSNVEKARLFPAHSRYVGASFVGTYDVAELYDVHRFQVSEYGAQAGIARLSRGDTVGEVMAYEDHEADLMYAFLVERGIFAPAGSTLEYTWNGAFLAVCRGVFPWREITRRQRARRRAAILARFRAAVAAGWTPDGDMRPAT